MNSVERVKAICKERKIRVSKLEKDCGFGNGYIGQLKKGTFPDDRLYKIAAYLDVDPQYLLFGETEDKNDRYFRESTILIEKYFSLDEHGKKMVDLILNGEYTRCVEPKETENIAYIRHYLYSPAAGVNGLVSGEDFEDIPLPDGAPEGADFCLTVSGDSMEPYIDDGEMIYVKEGVPINEMDVGVFYYDGSTYVKHFAPSYNGDVCLLSANPKRQDANITISKDSASSLVCFGKVMLPKKLPAPIYD